MIAEKKYLIPTSIDEAIEIAKETDDFKYMAGGTDVMVNRFQENETATCLIDITKISSLKGIYQTDEHLRIGALETLEDLKFSESVEQEFPMLIEAALSVGTPLIRKTATLGGNVLCENRCLYYNQSEWWRESVGYCLKCEGDVCIATQGKKACFSEIVSDTAPAIIAMDGKIEYADIDGVHEEKLEFIYTGDGVNPRNLSPTALVTAIVLPRNQVKNAVFFKLRERESLEFTSLTVAMSLYHDGKVKIALAGVDPKVIVFETTLDANEDETIKTITKKARAVDNDMYSRKYRREMIGVYVRRGLNQLKK